MIGAAVVTLVTLVTALALIAVWTGDHRYGASAAILGFPTFIAAVAYAARRTGP